MVESIRELKSICRKPYNKNDPLYSRLFVRNISIYLTKFFLIIGMSTNQVTLLSLLVGILGAFFLFLGNLYYMLIGILLLNFVFILDASDGEVARYRKKTSLVGVHLDQVTHQLLPRLYYFGLAYSVFINLGISYTLILGLLCSVFSTSLIMNALCYELVHSRLLEIKLGKKKEKGKEEKSFFIGEVGEKYNHIYAFFKKINFIFICPYDKIIILFIIILEIVNTSYSLLRPFTLLYFLIFFYGISLTLIQLSSFIINIKSKSIEKYYNTLFKK